MARRLVFLVALLAVVGLVFSGVASASNGTGAKSRIGAIDLVMPVVVGASSSSTLEHHQAINSPRSDFPSGATLAAGEIGAPEVGAGASRPNPEVRLPGSYLDWSRQNVVSNSTRVPLQGPMECGPYSTEIVTGVPAETTIQQLGPRLGSDGVAIGDLANALEEMPQTQGQFGRFVRDGRLDVQAIQELTADGPVVAHFPVYSAYEYVQIDGHFMVIEDVTASGNVRLLDTELGQSFEVTMGELDAAWSRQFIGRR